MHQEAKASYRYAAPAPWEAARCSTVTDCQTAAASAMAASYPALLNLTWPGTVPRAFADPLSAAPAAAADDQGEAASGSTAEEGSGASGEPQPRVLIPVSNVSQLLEPAIDCWCNGTFPTNGRGLLHDGLDHGFLGTGGRHTDESMAAFVGMCASDACLRAATLVNRLNIESFCAGDAASCSPEDAAQMADDLTRCQCAYAASGEPMESGDEVGDTDWNQARFCGYEGCAEYVGKLCSIAEGGYCGARHVRTCPWWLDQQLFVFVVCCGGLGLCICVGLCAYCCCKLVREERHEETMQELQELHEASASAYAQQQQQRPLRPQAVTPTNPISGMASAAPSASSTQEANPAAPSQSEAAAAAETQPEWLNKAVNKAIAAGSSSGPAGTYTQEKYRGHEHDEQLDEASLKVLRQQSLRAADHPDEAKKNKTRPRWKERQKAEGGANENVRRGSKAMVDAVHQSV